jgi:hypothetical protein
MTTEKNTKFEGLKDTLYDIGSTAGEVFTDILKSNTIKAGVFGIGGVLNAYTAASKFAEVSAAKTAIINTYIQKAPEITDAVYKTALQTASNITSIDEAIAVGIAGAACIGTGIAIYYGNKVRKGEL